MILWKRAGETIGIGDAALRTKIAAIDRTDGPWRVEQKAATAAAWLLLALRQ